MFSGAELMFAALEHVFAALEHKFCAREHKNSNARNWKKNFTVGGQDTPVKKDSENRVS